ncbi:2-keto-4-pentenoate hydratase [Devosia salina]|uniref:Fumarylacetoacetate hydrolase family protein n=1 Tax=Devosia salina TaxID=2860336 RepID=A0ABX8WDW6_9HYPH|nr:fumarylacetoacetate hydrolase family protein [Devosia salina]QYO75632.1 fumarylacetoacetate hydrolase family protein [Devosia salina]
MTTTSPDLDATAALLDDAAREARGMDQLGLDASVAEAYDIQRRSMARREARGERLIGIKMGLTSRAKMAQVNITEVIWGQLTDAMVVENGGTMDASRFGQPRAEPEIAFRLGKSLSGVVTELEAWAAIEGVAPAVEILDSRFRNFKFNLADAIADNCSAAGLVVGPWTAPGVDFSNLGMCMSIDGRPVGIGSSAAILGHPIRTLVAAARLTAQYGGELRAGDIFLSGAPTAAVPLKPGMRVSLEVQSLGQCGFSVTTPSEGA